MTAVQGRWRAGLPTSELPLEVVAGPTWRDPWTVPAPFRGPEPAKPIRVALVVDPAGQGTAKQVQEGVRKAAGALDDAGYAVGEVDVARLAGAKVRVVETAGLATDIDEADDLHMARRTTALRGFTAACVVTHQEIAAST